MNQWELRRDLEQQHISHAYLLVGDQESTLAEAKEFAMALNCLAPVENQACGTCRNCVLAQADSFCDFTILAAKKEAYSIEEIRNFNKIVQYTPQEGRYRIFLLRNIDKMDAPAVNAMLKTLEEPTPETVLLLLAENEDKLLPTVLSRCHILRWEETSQVREEDLDTAYELLTKLPHLSMDTLFSLSEKYTTKNKDELRLMLYAAEEIISNNYEHRFHPGKDDSRLFSDDSIEETALLDLWQKAADALAYLEANSNPRLIADTFFLAVKETLS